MNRYIVTLTAKRKNAKRHIAERCSTLKAAEEIAERANDCYIVEIYTGNWELIKRVK